jgi:hypothetical protein
LKGGINNMGIFGGKKAGWDCKKTEDGKMTCIRFESGKGEKIADGTQITIGVNNTTCEPYLDGDISILDDDEDQVNKIAKKMSASCRKGL